MCLIADSSEAAMYFAHLTPTAMLHTFSVAQAMASDTATKSTLLYFHGVLDHNLQPQAMSVYQSDNINRPYLGVIQAISSQLQLTDNIYYPGQSFVSG